MAVEKKVEWMGCRNLVYAEVLTDDNEADSGYTTGTVKSLAGVRNISTTYEQSSETFFYDNQTAGTKHAQGAATVTFEVSIPSDEVYADIIGIYYDTTKKYLLDTPRKVKYFAVGYVIGDTSDEEAYVWKYKGTFSVPDTTHATKDNSTTSNNMTLTFTSLKTNHLFTKADSTKESSAGIKLPATEATVTEEQFFKQVYTPETTII